MKQEKRYFLFVTILLIIFACAGIYIPVYAQTDEESVIYEIDTINDYRSALIQIKNQKQKGAVIILNNDIDNSSNSDKFSGVTGKKITVKSKEGNKFPISLASELNGDITFDNVKASADILYCNGHKTIFTENSELTTSSTVFGGGNKKDVESTYLVMKGISHVNTSDRDFNVVAGCYKASVKDDTYLHISGHLKVGSNYKGHHITGANAHSIYGGDYYNGTTYVGGDVTVIIDIIPDHNEYFPVSGTYHSRIDGNLNLIVKSGYVQEICSQQGLSSVTEIKGDVHLVVGDESYENTDRIVRPGGNWSIYGAGNQFAPIDYNGQLYKVGGDITVDTYENLWAWGEYNNSSDYPPGLYGAYYGDVGGNVTVNVHGSHLRRIYGASESTVNKNIIVNAEDAELDDKEVKDPSIPTENKNGGGIYGAYDSSCNEAVININGGRMYEASMTEAMVENGAAINITGLVNIRGAIFGNRDFYDKDQKMVLNIDDAEAEIPTLLFFSDLNIGKSSDIKLGRAESGDIPFININNLNIKEKAVLVTKDGNTELLGDVDINDADWFSLSQTSIGGNVNGTEGSVYFKIPSIIKGNAAWDETTLKFPAVEKSGYQNYDGADNMNISLTIDGMSSGRAYVLITDKNDEPVPVDPKLKDNYILSEGTKNQASDKEIIYYLTNDKRNQGYYLEPVDDLRKSDPYSNMWQVAKRESYGVLYDVKSSKQEVKLPDKISDLLITDLYDDNNYFMGDTVTALEPPFTILKETDGVWTFKGYEEGSTQVVSQATLKGGKDETDKKLYIHFSAVWDFAENDNSDSGIDQDSQTPADQDKEIIENNGIKTGDKTNIALLVILLVASVSAIALTVVKKHSK